MKKDYLIKKFNEKKNRIEFDSSYLSKDEGERIEVKCARITENNEPISDGAPLVYTKRSEGVKPEYDIRTDKWDIAQEKMQSVNQAKKNKIKENMTKGLPNTEKNEEEEKVTEN